MAVELFPFFLNLSGQPCLVVGGGREAEAKAFQLLAAGAQVSFVSEQGCSALLRSHSHCVYFSHLSQLSYCADGQDVAPRLGEASLKAMRLVVSNSDDPQVDIYISSNYVCIIRKCKEAPHII